MKHQMPYKDRQKRLDHAKNYNRGYHQAHKAEINARHIARHKARGEEYRKYQRDWRRNRYQTDPVFREKAKKAVRDCYRNPVKRLRILRRVNVRDQDLVFLKSIARKVGV